MLLILMSALFSSCEDKHYYEVGADMENRFFTVEPHQWKWNAVTERMEAVVSFDYIDEYIYEHGGAVSAGVYITKIVDGREIEVLCNLPYLVTDYDRNENEFYTVNMGFEISRDNRGKIIFYIQDSSLAELEIRDDYEFKVTVFWVK